MRGVCFFVLVAIGCHGSEPAPVTPNKPAPPPATDPVDEPVAAKVTPDVGVPEPAPEPEPATDCVADCIASRQMQAVAIEMIERDCARSCEEETATPPPEPDEACKAAAAAARKTIETGPMRKRAPKVFAAVADAALSCGVASARLQAIAKAGATRDLAAREAALREVWKRDPDFTTLCPAGTRVIDEVADQPEPARVAWLAKTCPIDDPHADEPVFHDVGPMTYLAITAIETHWAKAGATTGDHDVILNIARLASALERDAQR